MPDSEHDLARRALKAALEKLDANGASSTSDSESLVVLVVGGTKSQTGPGLTSTHERAGDESCHPGLEKFPLASRIAPVSETKSCFMEPERPCVNSGACEMRGY